MPGGTIFLTPTPGNSSSSSCWAHPADKINKNDIAERLPYRRDLRKIVHFPPRTILSPFHEALISQVLKGRKSWFSSLRPVKKIGSKFKDWYHCNFALFKCICFLRGRNSWYTWLMIWSAPSICPSHLLTSNLGWSQPTEPPDLRHSLSEYPRWGLAHREPSGGVWFVFLGEPQLPCLKRCFSRAPFYSEVTFVLTRRLFSAFTW